MQKSKTTGILFLLMTVINGGSHTHTFTMPAARVNSSYEEKWRMICSRLSIPKEFKVRIKETFEHGFQLKLNVEAWTMILTSFEEWCKEAHESIQGTPQSLFKTWKDATITPSTEKWLTDLAEKLAGLDNATAVPGIPHAHTAPPRLGDVPDVPQTSPKGSPLTLLENQHLQDAEAAHRPAKEKMQAGLVGIHASYTQMSKANDKMKEEYERQISLLDARIAELEAANCHLTESHMAEIQRREKEQQQELKKLRTEQKTCFQQQIKKLNEDFAKEKAELIADFERQKEASSEEFCKQISDLSLEKSSLEKEKAELISATQILKAENAELIRTNDALSSKAEELIARCETLEKANTDLKSEKKKLEDEKKKLEDENKKLEEFNQAYQNRAREHASRIAGLEKELESLKKQIQDYESRTNRSELQKEIDALIAAKAALTKEVQSLKEAMEMIQTLTQQRDQLQSDLQTLKSTHDSAVAEVASLKQIGAEKSRLEQEIARLTQENAQIAQDATKITQLEAQIANLTSDADSQKSQLEQEIARLTQENTKIAQGETRITELEAQIANLTKEKTDLTQEKAKLESELVSLRPVEEQPKEVNMSFLGKAVHGTGVFMITIWSGVFWALQLPVRLPFRFISWTIKTIFCCR